MQVIEQRGFRVARIAICILLGCSLFSLPADAQVSEARLTGVVMDASGAVVPGAQISITNVQTDTTRDLTTNQSGLYNAPGLPAGNYTLKISAPGFETELRTGITLTTGAEQVLNITLKVGNVAQQVVVTDVPPQVQLSTAALSDVVDSTSVRELPLNGRSWTDLAALTTGVNVIKTQPPVSASDRPKRGLGAELSISGGRPQQNSYLLDGININDYSNAGPGSILGGNLGVDAIQEFNVITTNAMAQYGRTSGGVISAITRSGTNELHGSAYEFLRNSALDAKNYFDNSGAIPPFRQNQFGASAGGPIKKNNTFVFGDYEGIRQTLGQTNRPVVPTAAARAGTLVCTSVQVGNGVCTPAQATYTVAVDPQAARFLSAFFPLPNIAPSGPSDTGIYSFAGASLTSENYFTIKVDHAFSGTDNVAATYMFDDNPNTTPDELNNKLIISKTRRQLISILENHIFSPSLENSVHVGFSRDNAGSPVGSRAVNPAAADTSYGFAPGETAGGIQIGGLVPFSGGLTTAFPLTFRWNSYQAYDDVSLTKGIHTFTFGANLERILDNQSTADFPGGIFAFNSLSDFLQNKPFSLQIDKPGYELPRDVRQTMFGTYFQDDIKFKPNLTINLALRYEIASVPEETAGRMSNLRVLSGNTPSTGSPYYRNPSLKNFEPRIGFAWDPFHDGRTSVRGGFGYYDILPLIVETGPGLDGVAPFDLAVSGSNLGAGLFPTGAFPVLSNMNSFILYLIQFNPPRNYVMQWNLNLQRQIRPNTTVMLAYVGSRGIHMWYQTDDGNIVRPVAHTSDGYFWPSTIGGGTVIDPQTGRVPKSSWSADSRFHGFEAELLQRLSHNVQGQVSFTWSRCIDTSSGSAASDQYRNSLPATFWLDARTHRGPCDTNITRNLVANAVWDVPHPKTLPGILEWATSGWQMTGIFTASSGQPFSVVISGDPMGLNSVIPFAYPDRLRGPGCGHPVNPDNPNNYIKLSCFSLPVAPTNPPVACTPYGANASPAAPVAGTCANKMGNAGRNGLVGPGIVNLDFSVYKSNPLKFISEKADLQFRAEGYNVFNRPDFSPPNDNFTLFDNFGNSISTAGVIDQTTVTAREIQFALKFTW
jgi:hypothetical protein